MEPKGYEDDAATLLYLVPFVATGVYAIYLWASNGASLNLPPSVYLGVTQDPYLYLLGSLAVLLAVVLDVTGADSASRAAKLASASKTLLGISLASLVLLLVCVLYADGSNLTAASSDLFSGRFGLIFPASMFLASYVLTTPLKISSLMSPKMMGIAAMFLVPVAVYEIGRHSIAWGLGSGAALMIAGVVLFRLSIIKVSKESKR